MRNADKVEQYFLMQGFKKFIIHLQNFMILTLYSRKLTFWRLDHEQSCSHNKIVKVSKYAGLLDFFNIMCKSVNVIVILRTGLGRRNDSWMDDAKRKFKGYCDTWNKVGRTEIKENVWNVFWLLSGEVTFFMATTFEITCFSLQLSVEIGIETVQNWSYLKYWRLESLLGIENYVIQCSC